MANNTNGNNTNNNALAKELAKMFGPRRTYTGQVRTPDKRRTSNY